MEGVGDEGLVIANAARVVEALFSCELSPREGE